MTKQELSDAEVEKLRAMLALFNDDLEELKVKLEHFDDLIKLVQFVEILIEERERWKWAKQTLYNAAKWIAAITAGIAAIKSGVIQEFLGLGK